jgi:hypothetical protein
MERPKLSKIKSTRRAGAPRPPAVCFCIKCVDAFC